MCVRHTSGSIFPIFSCSMSAATVHAATVVRANRLRPMIRIRGRARPIPRLSSCVRNRTPDKQSVKHTHDNGGSHTTTAHIQACTNASRVFFFYHRGQALPLRSSDAAGWLASWLGVNTSQLETLRNRIQHRTAKHITTTILYVFSEMDYAFDNLILF